MLSIALCSEQPAGGDGPTTGCCRPAAGRRCSASPSAACNRRETVASWHRRFPAGCTAKTVGNVEYYHCGGNYYRAVFQGNNLVYVTAKP